MYANIKTTENDVQVVYTKYGAGCLIFAGVFMVLASLVALIVIPGDSGFVRSFLSIIVSFISLVFFGGALLRILLVMMQGKAVMKIENGFLKNRTQSVDLKNIKEIDYGWHSGKLLSGKVFKDVIVKTVHNKRMYFSTYNLISDIAMEHFIQEYIVPQAAPECRAYWENNRKAQ